MLLYVRIVAVGTFSPRDRSVDLVAAQLGRYRHVLRSIRGTVYQVPGTTFWLPQKRRTFIQTFVILLLVLQCASLFFLLCTL